MRVWWEESVIKNKSGIKPFRNCLLLLPKQLEGKTEAGIIVATSGQLEREQLAQTEGIVVALGALAFKGWEAEDLPKIGDTVVFTRYAGMMREGEDELQYRLIIDEDVKAIVIKKEVSE